MVGLAIINVICCVIGVVVYVTLKPFSVCEVAPRLLIQKVCVTAFKLKHTYSPPDALWKPT